MAREEWAAQCELAQLLTDWLPPDVWWTAVDNIARSAGSGAMRRQRGCQPGTPDTLVLYDGRLIGLEMKAPGGRCSRAQKAARARIVASGGDWWECRSAHAAMWALARSGVEFLDGMGVTGVTDRWRRAELADWEMPRRDPTKKRPLRWDVQEQRRAARQRWKAAKARRKAQAGDSRAGADAVPARAADGATGRR